MIEIKNLDNAPMTSKLYGGHSGSKKGIIIDNVDYLLKFPKSTISMDVKDLSYTTTPLSEYLGSHIYQIIGIHTHDTLLGIINNKKLVVACKDFLDTNEIIYNFNAIRNNYEENIEEHLEKRSSSKFNVNDDLEDIMFIMNNNYYFKKIPELKLRFWDMFIVDTLISNNDRNEGNWGLIFNTETKSFRIAPVYDNGAAFYGKKNDDRLQEILTNAFKFKQVAYDSSITNFTLKGKLINPIKYIMDANNDDCNAALKRIYPKIDLAKIEVFFEDIPEESNGIEILSKVKKEAYLKILKYRLDLFKTVYEKIK